MENIEYRAITLKSFKEWQAHMPSEFDNEYVRTYDNGLLLHEQYYCRRKYYRENGLPCAIRHGDYDGIQRRNHGPLVMGWKFTMSDVHCLDMYYTVWDNLINIHGEKHTIEYWQEEIDNFIYLRQFTGQEAQELKLALKYIQNIINGEVRS